MNSDSDNVHSGRFNIMQVIGDLQIGGAQEVVRTLVKYLQAEGQNLVVVTFKDGPISEEIKRLNIPVEVLNPMRYSVIFLPGFIWDMFRIRRDLKLLIEKYNVDVIQTHLLRRLDFIVLSLRFGRIPRLVFWTIHNSNFMLRKDQLRKNTWLWGPKRVAYKLFYRVLSKWVSGIIAVSDDVKTAILSDIGPIESKVTIIPNGVDIERFQLAIDSEKKRHELNLSPEDYVIAVVGTLKEQKGHHYLIEAAQEITQTFNHVNFLFIGDGELRDSLWKQISSRGLQKSFHFLGNRNDIPELLKITDLFVLPSLWEGLPMALIEAMASGIPVIATQVSGSKQVVVSGKSGLLVPPKDARRLCKAISSLVSDPKLARELGHQGFLRVDKMFHAQQQAREYLSVYCREWDKLSLQ